MIGSTEMNRPIMGSYSRAPMWVRPLSLSFVPPTKVFSPAQAVAWLPRASPKGPVLRRVTVCVASAVIWVVPVPW